MLKIKIYSVGKTKEKWLEEAFQEYVKRLQSQVMVECLWAKNDLQLLEWTAKENHLVCLDPTGRLMTSAEFSQFLMGEWEKEGSRLALVIGGAEGLPIELKKKHPMVSLSPLTFTHQITRLVLIEQIYRALEIQKGSAYHK